MILWHVRGPVVRRADGRDLGVSLTWRSPRTVRRCLMLGFLEARLVTEPALVELGADRIIPKGLVELRERSTQCVRWIRRSANTSTMPSAFHNVVAEAAASPVLRRFSAGLQHISGDESVGILTLFSEAIDRLRSQKGAPGDR